MLSGFIQIAATFVLGCAVSWLWEATGRIFPAPRRHFKIAWGVALGAAVLLGASLLGR